MLDILAVHLSISSIGISEVFIDEKCDARLFIDRIDIRFVLVVTPVTCKYEFMVTSISSWWRTGSYGDE